MKYLYIFLVLFLISFADNVKAEEPSCTKLMQNFENSYKPLTSVEREKIDFCNTFCDKIANYKNAQKYCGIDDCKVEAAATGKPSNWCCKMTNFWSSKTGVKENPLEALKDECSESGAAQEDFLYCISDYSLNSKMSDECCRMLPEIRRYDRDSSSKMVSYCSQKRAAQICISNYEKSKNYTQACCVYAKANSNKFVGTDHFKNNGELAGILESGVSSCGLRFVKKDTNLESCKKNFFKTKTYNRDCCAALEKGILIPDKMGIKYSALDRYCYPQNYKAK